MKDWTFFLVFISCITFQRMIELIIASHNEKWMKNQGAIEFGKQHYHYIVSMHLLFFISFIGEKVIFNHGLTAWWPIFLIIFLMTQMMRIWALHSLGRYWNTKIIVLPNTNVVRNGPYRFIKHPNYLIVSMEIILIPLFFKAYITATLFTLLNIWILSIRIPEEENALKNFTEYEGTFQNCNRFLPKLLNKYDS
ncbi:MAG: isoprenylcysteine carboxylmethyltransferase family protein [Bacillota bacterium]|nr:isoprenylcysteine carboxylmethyltransferase family protein [Bacillota bacterium]